MLGVASPAFAIERPKCLDEKPQENQAEVVEEENLPGAVAEVVPAAWLGVIGDAPTETLRQHLSLESGVVLRYVANESPAAEAGLMAHDIVLEVGGEKISSQDDLREAVSQHAPGDTIALTVISKGERVEREVVLGERPPGLAQPVPERRFGLRELDLNNLPDLRELRGLEDIFPGDLADEDVQAQLEEALKDMKDKLRNLEELPGMELDIEEMLKDLPRVGIKTASQITLMDDQGSVEMKFREGGREVVVRDLEGEVVYEGPWDNEQDRAAVPADIRERIEKLNFDIDHEGNGIRLQFGQPDPAPDAGDKEE